MKLLTFLFAILGASTAIVLAAPAPVEGSVGAPVAKREPDPEPVDKRWCQRPGEPC
ncbi:uncharacterized protein CIMG_11312 [Coccidioides immitis RS]|uniref:Alpha pheromone n=4 Tax=Coccidioides TaxID=5500 RepID=A0A0D8JXH2_COCIM|nr:uncharacterized protein CIMG_11312 [Coccidioides immitis RS]KMM69905.1 hypothetical protein CPAG_06218 [Coccidioides posadasii RMSCC 3488]KMP04558.1 hypothetical protein CIRG_04239 [Coccidioides immitis RMSCC 2394]KMU81973.1 hypothetical protein CISG_09434 [Coccidioides immitis RMSCC 3703]QVM09112.1 hypothetical protein D8B26_003778 [Coccidioides posadasii str. Silveira]KJF60973.1 hypothetical protein CIMG_11312 [Coccidioides immitis RS]